MKGKIILTLLVLFVVGLYAQGCNRMACPQVSKSHCNANNGQFIERNLDARPVHHCCSFCLYRGEIGERCNSTSEITPESRGYRASCQDQYAVCHKNTGKCGPYVT
ncbi:hypothetical protein PPL_04275 [Heterostelium album PN500]|uniref:Uncharacterized protein n=1 Tax=Heterostelium pallidum (strain ATCC 26659 / Pp 5 / PN500) TaxID=670386 RepID=D3B741_HETP5|nr:hypothetical protein PPL_04275 [Heterostelium album PN500]EFA82584.1 hypothetical protein PPL_04275 [Heterostelium album PN500]|eukprot:XP_020434701.1 hypothetical protein PPL_04275 [Heterostelium album PN500]